MTERLPVAEGRGRRPRGWPGWVTVVCVVSCGAFGAATVLSVQRGPSGTGRHVLGRRASADSGTVYLAWAELAGLVLARQSVDPPRGANYSASVESPCTLLWHDGGTTSIVTLGESSGWVWPRYRVSELGLSRDAQGPVGFSGYQPGRSVSRVTFSELTLPPPFLAGMAVVSAVPVGVGWWRRRRRGAPGFPVDLVPVPSPPSSGD